MDKQVTEHSLEDVALATCSALADHRDWFAQEIYNLSKQSNQQDDFLRATCTELYEADSEARAEATRLHIILLYWDEGYMGKYYAPDDRF